MGFKHIITDDNELEKNAGAMVVTSSSENSSYPDDNAATLPPAQPWRSTGVSGQHWQVDFVSAKSIDFIAVAGLNLTSSPGTFQFKSGDTDPPSDETHVLPAPTRGTSWLDLGATPVNRRYWRLEITDSSNSDGHLDVGYIVLGLKTEFTHGYGPDFRRQRLRLNRLTDNPFGTDLNGELLTEITVISFNFGGGGALNSSELDTLADFLDSLKGSQKTVFIAPDGTAGSEGYLAQFQGGGWEEQFISPHPFAEVGDITFKELHRGLPLPNN